MNTQGQSIDIITTIAIVAAVETANAQATMATGIIASTGKVRLQPSMSAAWSRATMTSRKRLGRPWNRP